MKKILFISLLLLLLAGCDTFHGCGPMVSKRTETMSTTRPSGSGYITKTEEIYYVTIRGDDGKMHTFRTTPLKYNSAKIGDIFCVE